VALAYRHGVPLEDMEFYQFHPTGIVGIGILLSEAARGEGGILRNDLGERFMERYAPTMKDLASRDVVSRSIYQEIAAGRGIDGKDYVHLDVRHLGADVLNRKLPDMSGFIRTYFGIEPLTELVPIQPTAHYAMGGIPTDVDGRVLGDEHGSVVDGLVLGGLIPTFVAPELDPDRQRVAKPPPLLVLQAGHRDQPAGLRRDDPEGSRDRPLHRRASPRSEPTVNQPPGGGKIIGR